MSSAVRAPVRAYIALGANLGNPGASLEQAMQAIAAVEGVELIRRSALYRTEPFEASGPDYVNAVVEIRTTLTAPALLAELQRLEQTAGRERPYHHAPRTLDLDVLTYGDAMIDSATLVIPHPRMGERAFVLVPLAEIAPHAVKPTQLQAIQAQFIERL